MFATKLTLILLGGLLSACWLFWIGPRLLAEGETADILYAFAGKCCWLLITFGFIIHIIKTARATAASGR